MPHRDSCQDNFFFLGHFQFDTNGDGQISTAELREAMKKLLGQQVPSGWRSLPSSLRQSINHCPSDLSPCSSLVNAVSLRPSDVHTFLSTSQVGHRDLEEILRDIDLNGDGHVDFEGKRIQNHSTNQNTP